jgi:hypothetical protein
MSNKRGMDIGIQTGKIYNFKITKIFKKAWRTNIIVKKTRVSTKENLNGLYNELTNSITENITNDDINSFVSLNIFY